MDRLLTANRDARAGRRSRPATFGAGLAAALAVPLPAFAQTVADVQRELAQMKQQYEAEMHRMRHDYDARLRRLEARLKAAEAKPAGPPQPRELVSRPIGKAEPPATPTAPAATAVAPAPVATTATAAAIPPPSPPVGFTFGTPPGEPWAIGPVVPPPATSASAFNPAIGVVLDGRAGYLSKNPNSYFVRGFSLGDDTDPGKRGLCSTKAKSTFRPMSTRICSAT